MEKTNNNDKNNYTETDLDAFIDEILDAHIECDDLPNVCNVMQTITGKERVKSRIKYLLFKEGMRNIDSAIGLIESEINMSNLND